MIAEVLTEELRRVRAAQHRLMVRAAYLEAARRRANTGEDERIIRSTLEAAGVALIDPTLTEGAPR